MQVGLQSKTVMCRRLSIPYSTMDFVIFLQCAGKFWRNGMNAPCAESYEMLRILRAPDREQSKEWFPLLCMLMSSWWTWTLQMLPLFPPPPMMRPHLTWYPNTWRYHVNTHKSKIFMFGSNTPPTNSWTIKRSCQGVPAPGYSQVNNPLHSQQDFATHQLGVVLLLCPRRGCLHQIIALQLYTSIALGLIWSAKHPCEHVGVNQLGIKWPVNFPHAIVITGWTLVQSILVNTCLNTLWSIRHSTCHPPVWLFKRTKCSILIGLEVRQYKL